jgi:4-hydroxythreonine-4-phosphate dehydrogenase
MNDTAPLPRLLITLGDVAGIGPEIVARAWPALQALCRPVVVGDPVWVQCGLDLVGCRARVVPICHLDEAEPAVDVVPCLSGSKQDLSGVQPGQVCAAAGRAAYDFLCRAIDLTLAGAAAGIVTAPLHKEGLRAAGLSYPGHTEILAERTGVREFAMVLAVPGLAVAHVTLHMALRDVFAHLSPAAVLEKALLLDDLLMRLLGRRPRLGVAALNPHASDGGLFGDEEATIIAPGVEAARARGLEVSGPWPSDTLFVRARDGEFDGIVAMYHDQGHIALKLMGRGRAVNISAGLPIVRTSVAHGTAYDIAGKGLADADSLVEAVRVAAALAASGPLFGGKLVTTAVQQLLQSFDALSEADKHRAAVEILRRISPAGERDVPEAALLEAADELFRALDAEEASHAQR